MNKKAQSISINTIIVALIALLVLVVLIAILIGNTKKFTSQTEKCTTVGGSCNQYDSSGTKNVCNEGYISHPTARCSDFEEGETKKKIPCCVEVFGSIEE